MASAEKSQLERRLDTLYRVSDLFGAIGDLNTLLVRIMEESKAVVHCEASALMLYDEAANELFFEVATGEAADELKEIRLKADEGLAGACVQERKTIVVDDCENDPRHSKKADKSSKFHTRNLIATPLMRGERLLGVLEVLNKKDDEDFSPGDIQIIEFFADQASIAVENAILLRENVQNERLAATGQAVLSISHYIKNILAGIQGSGSLVEMGLKAEDLSIIQEAWPILKRSQAKITSLVHDMLTYSKDREPEYRTTDVVAMLRDVVESNKEAATSARCELTLALDDDLGPVELEESRIHDGVLNLVVNAIDAVKNLPGGEVAVVGRHAGDDDFEIIIRDNGTGIPENIQKKIFDPFFSTKGSKGTGLGLAVTRKVVEEHKGTLTLESDEGSGTTFTIRLPKRAKK